MLTVPGKKIRNVKHSGGGLQILPWASYKEVTGERVYVNEMLNQIAGFEAEAFLFAAAQANWFFQKRGPTSPEAQRALADRFLEPALLKRVDAWVKDRFPSLPTLPPIFHRQQLLALMRWAGLMCSREGNDLSGERRYSFGKICLMMNDFLHSDVDPKLEIRSRRIEFLTQFLPAYELQNPPGLVYSVVRAYDIAANILPALPGGARYIETFKGATGFDLVRFLSLLFGIWSTLLVPDEEELRTGKNLILDPATSFT